MRTPMKCKLCGKLDNPMCDISVHENTYSNKPMARVYPIVNTWRGQYVFMCNDCHAKLCQDLNPALYEAYEPLDVSPEDLAEADARCEMIL